ncbi:hypothetical protein BDV97DRAFT_293767 [Delphinella strobiligena]|nr:hypothetical protein BDV97DRAFT_293767 [Delphinella strobiligena]
MGRFKGSWQPESMRKPAPRQQRTQTADEAAAASPENQLPLPLQQTLLNIFKNACLDGTQSDVETSLQEVKGHLYNRDFAAAFGKDEYLQAYAARWSPSRALGYAQIFHDLEKHFSIENQTYESSEDQSSTSPLESLERPGSLKTICLGGGAGAEIVGLAGWLKGKHTDELQQPEASSQPDSSSPDRVDVLCLDIARWDDVVRDLHNRCIAPLKLSKYASESAKAANKAFMSPETLKVEFQQRDILTLTSPEANKLFSAMNLVTLMFTLNELYSASIAKTQRLLAQLTASLKEGALLLVVDSAGSYSSVTINGAEKKYPMQWLLDHTLQPPAKKGEEAPVKRWEKLVSDDSRWFRLQEGMKYPMELENMRYQIHLYRRCGPQKITED